MHWRPNRCCGDATTAAPCCAWWANAGTTRPASKTAPAANPYLYFASQVHAGLDGIARQLQAPPATAAPYASGGESLPTDLGAALQALRGDTALCEAFGQEFVDYFTRIKQSEQQRFEAAEDAHEFQRREYFGRI